MTAARLMADVITVVRATDQLLVSILLEDLGLGRCRSDAHRRRSRLPHRGRTAAAHGRVDPSERSRSRAAPMRTGCPGPPGSGSRSWPAQSSPSPSRACWAGPIGPWSWILGAVRSSGPFPTTEPTTTFVEMPQGSVPVAGPGRTVRHPGPAPYVRPDHRAVADALGARTDDRRHPGGGRATAGRGGDPGDLDRRPRARCAGRRLVHTPADEFPPACRPGWTSAIWSGRWATRTWTRSTRATRPPWSPGCGCRCPAAGYWLGYVLRSGCARSLGAAGGDRA